MDQEIKKHTVVATVSSFKYETIDPKTLKPKTLYYLHIQEGEEEPLAISIGEKNYEHIKNLSEK